MDTQIIIGLYQDIQLRHADNAKMQEIQWLGKTN